MRAHGVRHSDQLFHDDQTILEENFTGSTTPLVVVAKTSDRNSDARCVCRG